MANEQPRTNRLHSSRAHTTTRLIGLAGLAVAGIVGVAAGTMGGCYDYSSNTELNPAGPPMVRQVILNEFFRNANGQHVLRPDIIAFGTHPDYAPTSIHATTTAAVHAQNIRVVMDEILLGNNLEEISCRGQVDEDAYARVPVGATPDDIARCAVPSELLATNCVGENAVCIGPNGPVGVLDIVPIDGDGAADDLQFIDGSVTLVCDDEIVPLDRNLTYWQPSGEQLIPADGGIRGLGPAIEIRPVGDLKSGALCTIKFAADVTDKDGIQVCAPAGGDVLKDCTPGDTSNVTFRTEELGFIATVPKDGDTAVSLTGTIVMTFTTVLDSTTATTANITLETADGVAAPFTITTPAMPSNTTKLVPTVSLLANTMYTVTVATTVTDQLGGHAAAPIVLHFTTGV